jgi:hypothetical protein
VPQCARSRTADAWANAAGWDSLTIGDDDAFNIRGPLTLEAWVKTERVEGGGSGRGAHQQILGKGDRQYALKINPDGDLEFFIYGSDGGGWRSVTAARDASFSDRRTARRGRVRRCVAAPVRRRGAGRVGAGSGLDARVFALPAFGRARTQIPGRDFDGLVREARVYSGR